MSLAQIETALNRHGYTVLACDDYNAILAELIRLRQVERHHGDPAGEEHY